MYNTTLKDIFTQIKNNKKVKKISLDNIRINKFKKH